MIAPARNRFMLPSNASLLLANNATSICSSVAVDGRFSLAIFDSVSPRLHRVRAACRSRRSGFAGRARRCRGFGRCGRRGAAGAAEPARGGVTGSTGATGTVAPGGSSRNV